MKKILKALGVSATPARDVEQIRSEIDRLMDERKDAEAMPRPPAEAIQEFSRFVDHMVEQARLHDDVSKFSWGRGVHTWPIISDTGGVMRLYGLFALTCREAIIAEMTKVINDSYEGRRSATAEEKAEIIRAIDDEVTRLSREEESLIRAAERDGIVIDRREDAPPEIVLAFDADLAA